MIPVTGYCGVFCAFFAITLANNNLIALITENNFFLPNSLVRPSCPGVPANCQAPTNQQIQDYKRVVKEGGCDKDSTQEQRDAFAKCAMAQNPQLFKNISDLTDDNQACRDASGVTFKTMGLTADCEVYGTPKEDCLVRCSSCLRIPVFGFDPTDDAIKAFGACPMSVTRQKQT